jgi:hypothetical protein
VWSLNSYSLPQPERQSTPLTVSRTEKTTTHYSHASAPTRPIVTIFVDGPKGWSGGGLSHDIGSLRRRGIRNRHRLVASDITYEHHHHQRTGPH